MKSQSGFSLIQVIVAAAAGLVLIMVLSTAMTRLRQASSSVEGNVEISSIRHTVLNNLDCRATFGITPTTALPYNCADNTDVILKRRGGSKIADSSNKLGAWTLKGTCKSNRLVVSLQRSGNDPLTSKPYNSSAFATDLFAGTSSFCGQYLDPSAGCGGSYPLYRGERGNAQPLCCRVQNGTITGGASMAVCAAGEYLQAGGGECPYWNASGGIKQMGGYMHYNGPRVAMTVYNAMDPTQGAVAQNSTASYDGSAAVVLAGEAWMTDCNSAGWAPQADGHPISPGIKAGDVTGSNPYGLAHAFAICCPR